MKDVVLINSRKIGNYFAFKSNRSKKPFKNPMTECRSIKLYNSDIIADIGAYIGEYSRWCSLQGVKEIFSYEATPDTFEILKKNKLKNMNIINKAVIGNKDDSVYLYISKGIGVTNSIKKTKGKSRRILIPAIQYNEAVKNATVVKIDVEGAEYSYNIIQPNIRALILEFHPLENENWKSKVLKIMSDLKKAGFKSIIEPKFKHGWDLNSSWIR